MTEKFMSNGNAQPPETHEDLEQYLPYIINRFSNMGQLVQNKLLQENNVNLLVLRTLSILQIDDGLTINEIATRTFMEQSTTSRAVDSMVVNGLVDRHIAPGDQRKRLVTMTEKGRSMLQGSWSIMIDYSNAICEGISSEEQEIVRDIFGRMFANLSRMDVNP